MDTKKSTMKNIFKINEVPLLLVIILATIILYFFNNNFLAFGNIHSLFLGASFEAVMAIGMTLLLITGEIDLSVGSIAGFSGVIVGMCLDVGMPVFVAVIMGLLSGVIIGFVNGCLVAKIKINSLIATLGMQMIIRGLIYVLTKGVGKPSFPDEYNIIGRYMFFGKIQFPIIVSLVLVIVFAILFAKSAWFRQFYFIGGNAESARYSGIQVNKMKIVAFTFMGAMAALSGVLLAARMGGAIPTQGQNMEMNVIAASVIGGASTTGGIGTISGSYLGVIIMALVVNAFNILGVDIYWQRTITGIILLVAVLGDILRNRKKD
ncbi:MAG TPA: ABC transporter permease [Clostridiales bacterium]|nr:ABC transporter permease [Clostridiales bacterium]